MLKVEKSSMLGDEKWSVAEANSVFSADLHSGLGWNLGELARVVDACSPAAADSALFLRNFLRKILRNGLLLLLQLWRLRRLWR